MEKDWSGRRERQDLRENELKVEINMGIRPTLARRISSRIVGEVSL